MLTSILVHYSNNLHYAVWAILSECTKSDVLAFDDPRLYSAMLINSDKTNTRHCASQRKHNFWTIWKSKKGDKDQESMQSSTEAASQQASHLGPLSARQRNAILRAYWDTIYVPGAITSLDIVNTFL